MPTADLAARRATLLIACAGIIFGLTLGTRNAMALFIGPINTATGLGLAAISLAFGIGQLMWGVTQPVAGVLSTRFGTVPVLALGGLMVAAGTALTPFATSTWALVLTVAVLGAGGAGFAGPSVLMAALNHLLPPERRAMATALVNAGGSMGQFVIVPLAQLLTTGAGWAGAMMLLGALAAVVVPLARVLRVGPAGEHAPGPGGDLHVRDAVRDPNFPLLVAGFFTCGFHVAFVSTHLPGIVAACGLPRRAP